MRRTLTLTTALIVLVAIAVASAWLVRLHLAHAWLERTLATRGYPEARFAVTAADLHRLVVADLALGDPRRLRVQRIEAHYTPWALLTGDASAVAVDLSGLRGELGAGTAGATRAAGDSAHSGPTGWLAAAMHLESVELSDARVEVASAVGPWTLKGGASLESTPDGPAGEWSARAHNRRLRVDGTFEGELADGRVVAQLDAREDDGFRIDVEALARPPWDEPRLRVDGEVIMPEGTDLPWALLPGPRPRAGDLRVALGGRGRMPLEAPPAGVGAMLARLAAGDWSGDWRVQGRGLDFARRFSGLDLQASGTWRTDGAGVTIRSGARPRLRVQRIDQALRERWGVPAFARHHADGPVEIDWLGDELLRLAPTDGDSAAVRVTSQPDWHFNWSEAEGRARLQARVAAEAVWGQGLERLAIEGIEAQARDWAAPGSRIVEARLTGGVTGLRGAASGRLAFSATAARLALAGVDLEGVRASLNGRIEHEGGRARVTLGDEGGQITVRRWRVGDRVQVAQPSRLRVRDAFWRPTERGRWGAALRWAPFTAEVEVGGRRERVRVDPGRVRAGGHRGLPQLVLIGASARLPERGWSAGSVNVALRPRASEGFATFEAGRLSVDAEPAPVAPIELSGRVDRGPGGYSLSGRGSAVDARVPFRVTGEYAPAAGAAAGEVAFEALRWRPDGPQPGDLFPVLEAVHQVAGGTSGHVDWRVDERGWRATGALTLDDLAGTVGGVGFEGLEGTTRLTQLRPPRTAGVQQWRVRRIASGVPVTDVDLRWQADSTRGSAFAIRLQDASGDVLGGRARVANERLDPNSRLNTLDVRLSGITLARLVAQAGVAGLEAQGQLGGRMPLRFGDAGLAVRDGRLRSRDGRIELRSEAAEAALRAGGRDADLLLAALRDFAFDTLELDVDAPMGGRGRIDIRLDGHNPAVLDGQALQYRLALTGAVTPLLETMARGDPLSDERIARHLDLRAAD